MSIFEVLMMICFGAAWPFSIYKSYKSCSCSGKSSIFLFIVLFGYLAGIIHKFLYNLDWAVIFYMINFVLVAVDTALFFRNSRIEKRKITESK